MIDINEEATGKLWGYSWFWALDDNEKLLYLYMLSKVSEEDKPAYVSPDRACFALSWHYSEFQEAYTGLHFKYVITGTPPSERGGSCIFKILPGRYCKEETIQEVDKRRRQEICRGVRAALTPGLKSYIHKLDNYTCVYCGNVSEHIDHVVPVIRGGGNEIENLVASCVACNLEKSDRLLSEIGWGFIKGSRPDIEWWDHGA